MEHSEFSLVCLRLYKRGDKIGMFLSTKFSNWGTLKKISFIPFHQLEHASKKKLLEF